MLDEIWLSEVAVVGTTFVIMVTGLLFGFCNGFFGAGSFVGWKRLTWMDRGDSLLSLCSLQFGHPTCGCEVMSVGIARF